MHSTQSLSPQVQNIQKAVKAIKEDNAGAKAKALISSPSFALPVALAELGLDETGAKQVLQAHREIKGILNSPAASDTDAAVQGVLNRLKSQIGTAYESVLAYESVVNA